MKLKKYQIFQLALNILLVIGLLVSNIILQFSELSFQITLYASMGIALLNVGFLLAHVMLKNSIKRLTGALITSIAVIAVFFYYIEKYVGHFDSFSIGYFILFYSIEIITLIVLSILNYKLEPQKPVYQKPGMKK